MCYTKDHMLFNIYYVRKYHILIAHMFQLAMTYQNGVTMYSTQMKWLYLYNWYSCYSFINLSLLHNYYTLYL